MIRRHNWFHCHALRQDLSLNPAEDNDIKIVFPNLMDKFLDCDQTASSTLSYYHRTNCKAINFVRMIYHYITTPSFLCCKCSLFVCLFVLRPTRKIFTHLETSPLHWKAIELNPYSALRTFKAIKFNPQSALRTIQQWEFFNVPHLLWHGPTLCNGHLRSHICFRAFSSGVNTCLNDLDQTPLSH